MFANTSDAFPPREFSRAPKNTTSGNTVLQPSPTRCPPQALPPRLPGPRVPAMSAGLFCVFKNRTQRRLQPGSPQEPREEGNHRRVLGLSPGFTVSGGPWWPAQGLGRQGDRGTAWELGFRRPSTPAGAERGPRPWGLTSAGTGQEWEHRASAPGWGRGPTGRGVQEDPGKLSTGRWELAGDTSAGEG